MMREQQPKRRLVSVLYADFVGSTEWAANDAKSAVECWKQFRNTVTLTAKEHGGHVEKMVGDGALLVFDSPFSAVQCALSLISKVHALRLAERSGVTVGISTGEVAEVGTELVGTSVNLASRLSKLASPNQALLDEATAGLLDNHVQVRVRKAKKEITGFGHVTTYGTAAMRS